jgi:hypothetical protein
LGFDVLFNCTTNLPIAIATPPNYLSILCGGKLKIKIKTIKNMEQKQRVPRELSLFFVELRIVRHMVQYTSTTLEELKT